MLGTGSHYFSVFKCILSYAIVDENTDTQTKSTTFAQTPLATGAFVIVCQPPDVRCLISMQPNMQKHRTHMRIQMSDFVCVEFYMHTNCLDCVRRAVSASARL